MRGATIVRGGIKTKKRFQSTHPLRGATCVICPKCGKQVISIHAPLAGCDSAAKPGTRERTRFQSTHPLRGATNPEGAGRWENRISIHAPLAGCDECCKICKKQARNFNPRTPCGVRRSLSHYIILLLNFNPRTPCGVRRLHAPFQSLLMNFNPRTPCGVRLDFYNVECIHVKFQSTHPLRGATLYKDVKQPQVTISIHAPLAGCDCCSCYSRRFQEISIHAPLAGCDGSLVIPTVCLKNFNPRTPCGVRQSPLKIWYTRQNFNPRTPCGVRRVDVLMTVKALKISIHAPLAGCDSKIAEIFPANLRKSYKISAKPNKERRCRVLGKGKAAAISDLARCEPPGENRNASGSHQIMSAPSGA